MPAATPTVAHPIDAAAFDEVLRQTRTARNRRPDTPDIEELRGGLPVRRIDEVRDELGLSLESLGGLLDLSARTIARYRNSGEPLPQHAGDRYWRLRHVIGRATEAFGDAESARLWLTSESALLNGETPLQRLDTEPGFREVEDMLSVIDETSAA